MVVEITCLLQIFVIFCCFFREDPGVGTTCVKDGPDFLWVRWSQIKLADVGQVLGIGERLLDFEISAMQVGRYCFLSSCAVYFRASSRAGIDHFGRGLRV